MGVADLFRLDRRVAVVVGGAGGLGAAIAHGLAAAGAAVAVADVEAARAAEVAAGIAKDGAHAVGVAVDVTSSQSVERMASEVETELGPVDVLVNSAGITRRHAATEFPVADWDRILAVNLTGVFLASQAVGRRMVARRRGAIINLASIAGQIGLSGTLAYAASKGGVVMLTRALAVEWASYDVRVNAIAPSWFSTALGDLIHREPEYAARAMRRVPVGRMGRPDELIGAAVYLASDASSMVTGHILAVDGGTLAS
jgi:NAD(P)-dependent dehydrogenase (short-subunit alcohol dehydrogenase family)